MFELRIEYYQKKFFFWFHSKTSSKYSDIKLNASNASHKEVRTKRVILDTLLASGTQEGKAIDINKALNDLFRTFCTPSCTEDGKRRKTTKSNLFTVLEDR